MGFGAAIGALVTERTWELPAAGASLRERWVAIAPEFAGHVTAIGYDADSGRLTLCPESAAWATKLRLEQVGVVEAANQSAGRKVVRGLRILVPGSVPVPGPDDVAAPAAAPKGPVKTRENACAGYRRALSAHQEVRPVGRVDTAIAEAAERQSRAMRELSARVFPEPAAGADDAPASIETTRAQRRHQAAAAEAAALRRARAERAAREGGRCRASCVTAHDGLITVMVCEVNASSDTMSWDERWGFVRGDRRQIQTAVLGSADSEEPLMLPLEAIELDAFRRRHEYDTFWCGLLLGGCGVQLTTKLYTDRVCSLSSSAC
ncbi:DUF721 domain-containing protein [Streptomyces sp. NPDC002928]|uniref:DUF721 domain-containing protein n=1 Tax=Streptomyces sp. NPDC002928 TaxID=3154440 RepID=UPI0033AB6EC2